MPWNLDPATRAAFENDGATVVRSAVSSEWVDRLRLAIERDIETPGPYFHGYTPDDGSGRFHGNLRLWEHDPDCRTFCLDSALPALAQSFFESQRVNLLYDQLFVKEPGTANRTRWHNDQPYWPISGHQVITFWVALDTTTQASGALEFVRGSHRWGKWFQPEKFGDTKGHGEYDRNPDYVTIPDIEAAREDYEIVTWDLEPGDIYVFHGLTVHGAGGNVSTEQRRRGYAVRYTGDDVRYDTRLGPNANLKTDTLDNGEPLHGPVYPIVLE